MIYISWTAYQALCAVSGSGLYRGAYAIEPTMGTFMMFCAELTIDVHGVCQGITFFAN